MSSFDALLGLIFDNGQAVELRGGLNFIGVTITQNESLNALNITFVGEQGPEGPEGPAGADGVMNAPTDPGEDSYIAYADSGDLLYSADVRVKVDGLVLSNLFALKGRNFADNGDIAIAWVDDNSHVRIGGAYIYDPDTGGRHYDGGAPVAVPNVTGSRGGNAALASLLTGLAAAGLITDSTSA